MGEGEYRSRGSDGAAGRGARPDEHLKTRDYGSSSSSNRRHDYAQKVDSQGSIRDYRDGDRRRGDRRDSYDRRDNHRDRRESHHNRRDSNRNQDGAHLACSRQARDDYYENRDRNRSRDRHDGRQRDRLDDTDYRRGESRQRDRQDDRRRSAQRQSDVRLSDVRQPEKVVEVVGERWRPAKKDQIFRDGDWSCPSCGFHNFARNDACKQCMTERPARRYDSSRYGAYPPGWNDKERSRSRSPRHDQMSQELTQFTKSSASAASPKIATLDLDTSVIADQAQRADAATVTLPAGQLESLTSHANRKLFCDLTGVHLEWETKKNSVTMLGTEEQRKAGWVLLKRVSMHAMWGARESRVRAIMDTPESITAAKIRFSAMMVTMKDCIVKLSQAKPTLVIGQHEQADIILHDPLLSRQHCIIELDFTRRGVYAIDCSTNGTWVNGKRLPAKQSGKVFLAHGDELTLKSVRDGGSEFGFIINLETF
jgi:hypothetical protein